MKSFEYSLTLILINKKINRIGLDQTSRIFFNRCGFDIIFNKNDDINNAFKEPNILKDYYEDWFIAMDLCPWTTSKLHLKSIEWDEDSENHRIEWSIYTVNRFLKEQMGYLNFQYSNSNSLYFKPFHYISCTRDLLMILENCYPNIVYKIIEKTSKFRCKFEIIKPLTDYGCNSRVDLVDFNNRKLICKTFKPDKLNYLRNEVLARKVFDKIINIPEIVEKGENYILIDYLIESRPISSLYDRNKLLNIKKAKEIFRDLATIFKKGYMHLDFHSGNVLVMNIEDIFYIDFEYLEPHKNEFTFLQSPGIIDHNKYQFDSPMEHITYKNYWKPMIGFDLKSLLQLPIPVLNIMRNLTSLKLALSKYLKRSQRKINRLLTFF